MRRILTDEGKKIVIKNIETSVHTHEESRLINLFVIAIWLVFISGMTAHYCGLF